MKKKLKFEKEIIYCNQGKVNTSYEKKNELIEHHSVLQFFVNKKYNEQYKYKKVHKVLGFYFELADGSVTAKFFAFSSREIILW